MFKQKPNEAKLFMKKTENEKANFFSMGKQRKGTQEIGKVQEARGKRQVRAELFPLLAVVIYV